MKDYLMAENDRNRTKHKVYERLLRAALQTECVVVVVGHHVSFKLPGNDNLNEIPSADTLIFDFELMSKVFGAKTPLVLEHLAVLDCNARDAMLEEYLNVLHPEQAGPINALARA